MKNRKLTYRGWRDKLALFCDDSVIALWEMIKRNCATIDWQMKQAVHNEMRTRDLL